MCTVWSRTAIWGRLSLYTNHTKRRHRRSLQSKRLYVAYLSQSEVRPKYSVSLLPKSSGPEFNSWIRRLFLFFSSFCFLSHWSISFLVQPFFFRGEHPQVASCAYIRYGTDKNIVLMLRDLKIAFDVLHIGCFVIQKTILYFIKDRFPATPRAESIHSRVRETTHSSSGEKQNMFRRREVYKVEWLNRQRVHRSEQCSSGNGGLPVVVPHVVCTWIHYNKYYQKSLW